MSSISPFWSHFWESGELNRNCRVKVALRSESVRPWHEVEHEFNESEYRAVRDRQMKELELEDDLLNKVPVRYVTRHALSGWQSSQAK